MSLLDISSTLRINGPTDIENIHKLITEIKPSWNLSDLKLHTFKDGITNKLFAVHTQTKMQTESCVLIKVFGPNTEMYIDRSKESLYIFLLHEVNFSTEVFATFANGICYGYTPGFVPNYEDLISPQSFHLVPEKMAALHSLRLDEISRRFKEETDLQVDIRPNLMTMCRKFINLMPDVDDPTYKDNYPEEFPTKETLLKEAEFLENLLSDAASPVGLCHNDLLFGNIIMSPNRDAVSFIDFEYCSYNYTAFDIANHFREHTIISPTTLDLSRYPSIDHQRRWLRIYLKASHMLPSLNFGSNEDEDDDEVVIDNWIEKIKKFSLDQGIVFSDSSNFVRNSFSEMSARFDRNVLMVMKPVFCISLIFEYFQKLVRDRYIG